ncbi:uncharacterized protein LTR77_002909 [Saxophila tyrrhenica]|uniref:SMODS and SLOG-associating 2TM effector domain-containing protein n=1 Tax=Saxophila tyrrhenica TaxID=1690608 RepID=A0AAV9PIP9_9PEZI|nr:hypothetical protein LTR77_002909 [Saxophila tyrrhenica]
MHELPNDLAQSLRSYRGSMYSGGRKNDRNGPDDVDLEKGEGGQDDGVDSEGEQDERANATQNSPDLHPPKSDQGQAQSHEQDGGKSRASGRQEQRTKQKRPEVDTQIEKAKSKATANTPAKQSIFDADPVKDPDGAADRLAQDLTPLGVQDFYQLMGLREPSSAHEEMSKLAYKNGLVGKILRSLKHTQEKYRAFAVAVYALLVLQLAIAAVFIVLGALGNLDTHVAIAVLGAISTVIAGALALMQGQGLPNRLRVTRNSLRNVVFEAEELFWDVRAGGAILYKDVKKLREDYLRVLEEQRRNHPDTFNSVTKTIAAAPERVGGGKRGVEIEMFDK